jgi:hypothetical protein
MSRSSDPVRKSRQHHVWQQYLRSWARGGTVYCLQGGRVFPTGTSVLGITTDFYKLQPLTDEDLRLIDFLLALDKVHPSARKHYEVVLQNVLTPMTFVRKNRDKLNNLCMIDDLVDVHNTNAVDDQHTAIESRFVPLLARSLSGDVSWYADDQDCISFCNFIGAQHMRTRGVKERTIFRLKERMGLDISRIWDVLSLIYSCNVGCSLFLERKRRTLLIVRNDTALPFVTGDQPVIILHGDGETPPESLSFYYPISPRLALYFGEPEEVADVPVGVMTAESVARLNMKMAMASHSQIYAETSDPLTVIRDHLMG